MDKFPITEQGYNKLTEEIKHLKLFERPKIIEAIASARELGDLSENAEYHAAREKQSFVEGKIIELEDKRARAEIINIGKISGDIVRFGATVTLIDEDSEQVVTYTILGDYEADISKFIVSVSSPIAKALIGKAKGDVIDVITPKSSRSYEILKVEYIVKQGN
jgi:transcription elongation factor GreA